MSLPKQTTGVLKLQSLLTPKQVAEALGISPGTLQVWRSTGRYNLPFVKCGRIMYRAKDVQAFIERRTMAHTA